MPLVSIRGVSYCHQVSRENVPILKNVSLDIEQGQCLALLGRSGSGKSTLLNLISGIDRADSGRITVNGQSIDQLVEPALTEYRRESVGFVYQFFNLIPLLTVWENVALPLELLGVERAERRKRAEEYLQQVGLEQKVDVYPDQLSGGEQQRVTIARALVHDPAVILADEPTGNLDAENGRMILSLLSTLTKNHQKTLLIVTHSREVGEMADRQVVLANGCLTALDEAAGW